MKTVLRSGMSMLALAGMLMVTSPSYALPLDVTVSADNEAVNAVLPGGELTVSATGLASEAISDVLFTVSVVGDFDLASEYIHLFVDGLSGGLWLNEITGDDDIVGPVDDIGTYYTLVTGTVLVDKDLMNPLLADNALDFLFDYSANVHNTEFGDLASVRIQYEYAPGTLPSVPEPSTMLLLGTGLVGMVAWRMKKGQA